MSESAIGWVREVVLDGPDPWALARFWAGLLGGTPVEWYQGWVTLEPPPNGQRLSFQATATPLAKDTARVHFDILVADLASAHRSEEHTSELQSQSNLVCRLLLEKK